VWRILITVRSGIPPLSLVISAVTLSFSLFTEAQEIQNGTHAATPAPFSYAPPPARAGSSLQGGLLASSPDEVKRTFYASVEHPWRVVGGVTNSVLAQGWVHFYGRVLGIESNRVHVEGRYSAPFGREAGYGDFFVLNFPYQVTENDAILDAPVHHMAKLSGIATCESVQGTPRTIPNLDYGLVCDPPDPPKPPSAAIAAMKDAAAQKKAEVAARTLKHHQELAEQGDPYGQYHLGLRYAIGDGVEKDLAKARDWLTKAAAQGQSEAAEELKKLQ
jgi:hypothetical protein